MKRKQAHKTSLIDPNMRREVILFAREGFGEFAEREDLRGWCSRNLLKIRGWFAPAFS